MGFRQQEESNKRKHTVNRNERKIKPFCVSVFCKKKKLKRDMTVYLTKNQEKIMDMKKVYVSALIDIKLSKEKIHK